MSADTDRVLAAIEAMRARANAASPGPWEIEYDNDSGPGDDAFQSWYDVGPARVLGTDIQETRDAAFIARARADVPALADVAEAAARLRAAQRDYDNLWRDVIPATSIVTRLSDDIHDGLKALDAALARLAEVAG